MRYLNWPRVILSGVVWWFSYNLLMALAWLVVLKDYGIREFHPILGSDAHTGFQLAVFLVTVSMAIFAAWLYAAIRPRFGQGMRTAVYVGIALWLNWGVLPNWAAEPKGGLAAELAGKFVVIVGACLVAAAVYKEKPVRDALATVEGE